MYYLTVVKVSFLSVLDMYVEAYIYDGAEWAYGAVRFDHPLVLPIPINSSRVLLCSSSSSESDVSDITKNLFTTT